MHLFATEFHLQRDLACLSYNLLVEFKDKQTRVSKLIWKGKLEASFCELEQWSDISRTLNRLMVINDNENMSLKS